MKLISRVMSFKLENTADQIIFFMIANAVFLFLVSYLQILLDLNSLPLRFWSLTIFSIFGTIFFVYLIQKTTVFSPIAWFIFGASVFFGLGGIAGLLQLHSWTNQLFGNSYQYILNNGLLNGGSVATVLLSGWIISSLLNKYFKINQDGHLCFEYFRNRYWLILISLVGMFLLKIVFISYENYIFQSLLSKILLIQPFLFLMLGVCWGACDLRRKLLSCSVIFFVTASAFIDCSKYQIFLVLIGFMVGLWIDHKDIRFRLQSLIIICTIFIFINPIVTYLRSSLSDPFKEKAIISNLKFDQPIIAARDLILTLPKDSSNRMNLKNNDPILNSDFSEKFLFPALRRLDTSTIQGFLIERYQQGKSGDSMSEVWMLFVPRIVWKDKPVITRHGQELYSEFYNDPVNNFKSSVGPTYSAEGYWNYGVKGVLIVSILFGIILGVFEWMSKSLLYPLLAVPVIFLAFNLEAWFFSTVLGNAIIYTSIYMIFFTIKKRFNFGR